MKAARRIAVLALSQALFAASALAAQPARVQPFFDASCEKGAFGRVRAWSSGAEGPFTVQVTDGRRTLWQRSAKGTKAVIVVPAAELLAKYKRPLEVRVIGGPPSAKGVDPAGKARPLQAEGWLFPSKPDQFCPIIVGPQCDPRADRCTPPNPPPPPPPTPGPSLGPAQGPTPGLTPGLSPAPAPRASPAPRLVPPPRP